MPPNSRTSNHSANTKNASTKRLVNLFNDVPAATFRYSVHEEFGVSLWDGVDRLIADAKRLFSNIPPAVFTFSKGASQSESACPKRPIREAAALATLPIIPEECQNFRGETRPA